MKFRTLVPLLALALVGNGCQASRNSKEVSNSPVPVIEVVSIDPQPVLAVGARGTWDDTDVLNPSIVVFNGTMYNHYSGYSKGLWNTGTAISSDGKTWTKLPGPFLIAPRMREAVPQPIAANGASIIFKGKIFHYYERNRSDSNSKVSIWLATSSDGQTWDTSPGEVFIASGNAGTFDEDQVADPFVLLKDGTLYLYYKGAPKGLFRVLLGVATSTDGIHWTRIAGPLIPQGRAGWFDEFIQGEPTVVYTGKLWYMLIEGQIGRMTIKLD